MHTGLVHLHRTIAYVALLLLAFTAIKFLISRNKEFTEGDRKLAFYSLLAVHLQLIVGAVIYFTGISFDMLRDFGTAMGDSAMRFKVLEHPLTMIIGITVITIGYSSAKRMDDSAKKLKRLSTFYVIGLVLILLRTPWDKLF